MLRREATISVAIARNELSPRDRGEVHELERDLAHVWWRDDHLMYVTERLQRLDPEGSAAVYLREPDGSLGEIAHSLGGRLTDRPEEATGLGRVAETAQYPLHGRHRWVNVPVDTMRLYEGRAEQLDQFRQGILAPNGLWHQLRVTIYDGLCFVAYCGLLRARHRGEYTERERARMDALVPTLRDGFIAKRAIGKGPLSSGTIGDMLDAFEQPAFMVSEHDTIVYANAVARRQWPHEPPAWLAHARREPEKLRSRACVRTIELDGRPLWLVIPRISPAETGAGADPLASLPPRLARIARLVAEGLADKEVAQQTGLSLPTVRTYVTHVYRRLGVHGRVELAKQLASAAE